MIDYANTFFQIKIAEFVTGIIGIVIMLTWYFREKKKLRKK